MFYTVNSHAETFKRTVANIGQFSVIQESCDEDANKHCDFVLYEGDDYRLPLVVDWERGLNFEHQTNDFLHLSYGYTFNLHHSLFISKDGVVQALDDVVAVDEKSGCIARFEFKDAPTIIFQKMFRSTALNKIQLKPNEYFQAESVWVDASQYFSDMKFDEQGRFNYRYANKNAEEITAYLKHPCKE
ncbi:hypothetical protein [Acinetobacter bereziniae]|uniref:hypothetical protein n=1 Tax=Acinetobacter bereziniae TaxID=106648 RepID=UPI00124FEF10|nr:hypothetical protein [Acinetobacter bereziniae]MCU4416855.1 hypothetical protein [Acinetobacter bereziniae]